MGKMSSNSFVNLQNTPSGVGGIIHLDQIRKSYIMGKQQLQVLKGISLNINKNEYVALMGPSGSGKSTLLELAAGLISPSHGKVLVMDNDLSRMSEKEKAFLLQQNIGIVLKNKALLPYLTARENVSLAIKKKNGSRKILVIVNRLHYLS